ncbi:transporter, major facilitator family protein [Catonella morbi ATCC 51271]|uniref:Transporter, major facilitator family protein n=1 Tax=Catonella morbi ATCC 51271 TaxID=592026 RepID=V2Y5Y3_9FIRM|nr:glycoside-pentoside-hexuronide (GPH):cation symporter [Catonella morbi]ESL04358.1 transporter, major facilitator family protein [Catonella morbi ATCC 51271]
MEEKKYLKWYNKVGYGAGDIAGNVVYALLAAFVMIYLTDTVGLNAGIVGTLIAVSKIFDGISDIFFGAMIDKTKSKMGKARPWMLYGYFGCAVCLVAIFCIPVDMGQKAQYAWFFIAYTLLNAGFYTANNIAYSALTALITKNNSERVQMGSIRFMFAFGTSMLIQAITVGFVAKLGGGAAAWRTVAIIYSIIGVISNTLSVLSVKELSDEELAEDKKSDESEEKYNLISAFKLLVHNKYFLMICGSYLLMQLYSATLGMGIYFMKYVLGDEGLFGTFSWAINIPMIVGLLVTPILVAKFNGMYKLNVAGYVIGTAGRLGVVAAGYMGNIMLMLAFTAVAALGMSPLQGDMNALIATTSEYTRLTTGKKVDGTMYSCTSFGTKVGGGLGTAIAGWMLAASGYVQNAVTQSQPCVNMLYVMYLWLPMIFNLIITFVLIRLNVEKANKELQKQTK